MNNLIQLPNLNTDMDSSENKKKEKEKTQSWFYYLTYWAVIFFLLHIFNVIPFSPFLFYSCIVIFITLEILYLVWYQIYYRITDSSNPNIIRTKKSVSLLLAWLIVVLLLDIIPFFMLEPRFDLGSTLFTGIIVLVYLVLCRNTNVTFLSQYFSKGLKFNINSEKYTAWEYILFG